MSRAEPTLRTTLFVLFGPIVWAVHFLIVYGAHASICAVGDRLPLMGRGMLPWLFATATAAALLLVAAALLWPGALRRLLGAAPVPAGDGLFLIRLMRALGVLSSVAIAWAALAILLVPRCAPL